MLGGVSGGVVGVWSALCVFVDVVSVVLVLVFVAVVCVVFVFDAGFW